MAGLNSLGLGMFGLAGRAAGMIPGMGGGPNVPGPMSGIVPQQRIGGAVPGMLGGALGGVAGGLFGQLLTKKKKKQMAGQVPTTPAANGSTETPTSPAAVGRGLAAKPKAAYIGY